MKAQLATPENIIPLTVKPRPAKLASHPQRFNIKPFTNERTGSKSWRVTGIKRDGSRVRENFTEIEAAQCRQVELETEWLTGQTETAIRATKLTDAQIRLAEAAFVRLDADNDMPLAVEYWLKHGKALSVVESPRLDDAFKEFCEWLPKSGLRDLSQKNLRRRVNVFVNSVSNMRLADTRPETIEKYLDGRNISPKSKDNDRRALSRFFSWCIERPRHWLAMNPCREIRITQAEAKPPSVLTVEDCKKLLARAVAHRRGCMVPFLAVSMFGGLRPFEAAKLTWPAVNLTDGEIRLEGIHTKTGKPRVVAICDTLGKWLKAYEGKPFFPSNWRRDFDEIKSAIGYGRVTAKRPDLKPWPVDILRHTAISHYFRKTGSYGNTAEQFGNSEAIIKAHYQGRVTSADTKKFYALVPTKKGAK